MPRITLPNADEYLAYYGKYISLMAEPDVFPVLEEQIAGTAALLAATPESKAAFRYAEGKWSVKEVVGHLCDVERIFTYRATRIARADATPIEGFDENAYVPAAEFDRLPLAQLAAQFMTLRAATNTFFASLSDTALLRKGTANGATVSVRALAWIIAGHERHHVKLLRERYGLTG